MCSRSTCSKDAFQLDDPDQDKGSEISQIIYSTSKEPTNPPCERIRGSSKCTVLLVDEDHSDPDLAG